MDVSGYNAVLKATEGGWYPLTERQRWRALEKWRAVYAVPLHQATGRWKLHQFEWHVFSYKYVRTLNGARALSAYMAETSQRTYVAPESNRHEAGVLTQGRLPEYFTDLRADIYVWPEDLSWTRRLRMNRKWDLAHTSPVASGLSDFGACWPGAVVCCAFHEERINTQALPWVDRALAKEASCTFCAS